MNSTVRGYSDASSDGCLPAVKWVDQGTDHPFTS